MCLNMHGTTKELHFTLPGRQWLLYCTMQAYKTKDMKNGDTEQGVKSHQGIKCSVGWVGRAKIKWGWEEGRRAREGRGGEGRNAQENLDYKAISNKLLITGRIPKSHRNEEMQKGIWDNWACLELRLHIGNQQR